MSLFKQMALAVSLIIVILLGSVMAINYKSAKKNLQQTLYETTVNNISSLGSKLAQTEGDRALISSVIDAEFDSGYFKHISYTSSDESFTYEQFDSDLVAGVPLWFINIVDIKLESISEDVFSGWETIGTVKITPEIGMIYKALYKMFVSLAYIFILSIIISLIILSIMLTFILKPLKGVQKQAEALIRNEFIVQEKIPYTQEFKDVVLGMNSMVRRVKSMFEQGNEALKRQKELEYTDAVTQLKNRKYLIDKLPEYLKVDASYKGGVNMMIALSGIMIANEQLGHQKVDALYKNLADIFIKSTESFDESIVVRMNGTEFSIFIPNITIFDSLPFAEDILQKSRERIEEYKLNTKEIFLSIGSYEYNYLQSIVQLLSYSDSALAQAKFNDSHIYLAKASTLTEVMGKNEWRELLQTAIKKSNFHFISYPVVDTKAKTILHAALSLTLKVDDKTTYNYGQFMASAMQIKLGDSIYKHILQEIFTDAKSNLDAAVYSLRVSYEFLHQEHTYSEMKSLFAKYAEQLPYKLIIEMPDKLLSKNRALSRAYKKLFETYKIEMSIFEFIGESKDYSYLQELRPLYIKAESSYFLTQSSQGLSSLKLITESIGISLIATSVMELETVAKLEHIGIHNLQGRFIESYVKLHSL